MCVLETSNGKYQNEKRGEVLVSDLITSTT